MTKPKKVKSGWQTQVSLGEDKETGKAQFKTITRKYKWQMLQVAEALERERDAKKDLPTGKTVGEAVDEYIALCKQLSPKSVESYESIRRNDFQDLMQEKIAVLDSDTLQRYIDLESERTTRRGTKISPKTIHSHWGLIYTAIKRETGRTFNVRLPKLEPKFIELPEAREVYEIVKGTDLELPSMIAMWLSFSLSEIRGIKGSSIKDGLLTIRQVVVDVHGKPIEKKQAKVPTRNRTLAIPPYIMNLIEQNETYQNYLKTGEDNFLFPKEVWWYSHHFSELMRKNGIDLNFHKLRHINASVMAELEIPTKYAQERGGWATDHTMKRVYQHTFPQARKEVDKAVDNYFEKICYGNAMEGQ